MACAIVHNQLSDKGRRTRVLVGRRAGARHLCVRGRARGQRQRGIGSTMDCGKKQSVK